MKDVSGITTPSEPPFKPNKALPDGLNIVVPRREAALDSRVSFQKNLFPSTVFDAL